MLLVLVHYTSFIARRNTAGTRFTDSEARLQHGCSGRVLDPPTEA